MQKKQYITFLTRLYVFNCFFCEIDSRCQSERCLTNTLPVLLNREDFYRHLFKPKNYELEHVNKVSDEYGFTHLSRKEWKKLPFDKKQFSSFKYGFDPDLDFYNTAKKLQNSNVQLMFSLTLVDKEYQCPYYELFNTILSNCLQYSMKDDNCYYTIITAVIQFSIRDNNIIQNKRTAQAKKSENDHDYNKKAIIDQCPYYMPTMDPYILQIMISFVECSKYRNDIYFNDKTDPMYEKYISRFMRYCPDTCWNNPCDNIQYAVKDKCSNEYLPGKLGIFKGEFVCECQKDYEWIKSKSECHPKSICRGGKHGTCKNDGKCQTYMKENGGHTYNCICSIEFQGDICEEKRNPCKNRFDKTSNPGNVNCMGYKIDAKTGEKTDYTNSEITSDKGTCTPIIGTDKYFCHCIRQFTRDIYIPDDNCFKQRSVRECLDRVCPSDKICMDENCYCKSIDLFVGTPNKITSENFYLNNDKLNCKQVSIASGSYSQWTDCFPKCQETLTSEKRKRKRELLVCMVNSTSYSRDYCQEINDLGFPLKETKICSDNFCRVNGQWSEWLSWTLCSEFCRPRDKPNLAKISRFRICQYKIPGKPVDMTDEFFSRYIQKFRGKNCVGNDIEVETCKGLILCPVGLDITDQKNYALQFEDQVNNVTETGMIAWTAWSKCSINAKSTDDKLERPDCGRGQTIRYRYCQLSNPDICVRVPFYDIGHCNTDCFKKYKQDIILGDWSLWSKCFKGYCHRSRTCKSNTSKGDAFCSNPKLTTHKYACINYENSKGTIKNLCRGVINTDPIGMIYSLFGFESYKKSKNYFSTVTLQDSQEIFALINQEEEDNENNHNNGVHTIITDNDLNEENSSLVMLLLIIIIFLPSLVLTFYCVHKRYVEKKKQRVLGLIQYVVHAFPENDENNKKISSLNVIPQKHLSHLNLSVNRDRLSRSNRISRIKRLTRISSQFEPLISQSKYNQIHSWRSKSKNNILEEKNLDNEKN